MLVLCTAALATAAALLRPSQSRCADAPFATMPFCDSSGARTTDERVADLVGRLSSDEKVSLLGNTHGAQPGVLFAELEIWAPASLLDRGEALTLD